MQSHPVVITYTYSINKQGEIMEMLNISDIVKSWKVNAYGWSVAPAGVSWCEEGNKIKVGEGVNIGEGAFIDEGASIGEGTSIGACAFIAERVSIGAGASIGEGSSIGEDASIGPYTHIDERIAIGAGAFIGAYTFIGVVCNSTNNLLRTHLRVKNTA
jgi:serine acetyltransferase